MEGRRRSSRAKQRPTPERTRSAPEGTRSASDDRTPSSTGSATTHERILRAAASLLAERGFHGVGMGEVARAARVSRQALYLHFASKPELFVAASEYIVARAEARVAAEEARSAEPARRPDAGRTAAGQDVGQAEERDGRAMGAEEGSGATLDPTGDPERRRHRAIAEIDTIIRRYARTVPETYGVATANYAARRSEPAAEEVWQNRTRVRLLAYTRAMAHLAAAGGLAEGWTEQEAADLLFSLLSVRGYETLVLECGWSLERYEERLHAVVHRTLIQE
jgi:AcrR family transcriptional regulator